MIRPEDGPTNGVDTGHTTMIGLPSWERWGGKADKCVYVWFTILTEKRWKHMYTSLRRKRQRAIPMNGTHITTSSESTRRFVMLNMNGLVTTMAMAFEKYTPTLNDN